MFKPFLKFKNLIFDNDKMLSSLHTICKNITQMNDRMHYIIMKDSRSTIIICEHVNGNWQINDLLHVRTCLFSVKT